jgi:voltage-dependent anion channel protein 2
MEGKYTDKALGKSTTSPTTPNGSVQSGSASTRKTGIQKAARTDSLSFSVTRIAIPGPRAWPVQFAVLMGNQLDTVLLMVYHHAGLTLTQTWNTTNILESKVELADNVAKGLKAEGIYNFRPAKQAHGAKLNLHFKQPVFHGRAFFDLLKGPTANIDAVIGHEGFLAGASAGYDVQKAAITGYSAAVGYNTPSYTAAITATDNLSVFAASYYHKVNSQVEAGAKATWNSKSGNAVGLEVASKYRIDPVSFAKVCTSEG